MEWQHPDETKKVKFIEKNIHDFHHPALLIQVPRLINKIFNFTDKMKIAVLGRNTTALFGALTALFMYLLIRQISGMSLALITALSIAFSPIMVIHSHYLKEDIIFVCFAVLTLVFIMRLIKQNNIVNGLFLGASLGLALSSQYKGVLLIFLILIVPIIIKIEKPLRYYTHVGLAIVISFAIFALVNYLIFLDPANFWSGLCTSTNHVIDGHDIKIYALPQFFTWHFVHSIVPGISLPLAVLALVMIVYSLINWRKLDNTERVAVTYILIFYFAAEATPLKAFPDYIRYVIPVVPLMLYFACKSGWTIVIRLRNKMLFWPVLLGYIMILGYPLYDSINLVYYLKQDTRSEAKKWISDCPHKLMVEKYVYIYRVINSLADYSVEQWQANGFEFLIASSFEYDRYLYGEKLNGQDKDIYKKAKRYEKLFNEYPYEEIKPKYKTFAFSNPTIRIIDIRPMSKKRKN